jgi:hypothetical protein
MAGLKGTKSGVMTKGTKKSTKGFVASPAQCIKKGK